MRLSDVRLECGTAALTARGADPDSAFTQSVRSEVDPSFLAARFSPRRSLSVLCGFFLSCFFGLSALLLIDDLRAGSRPPSHDDVPVSILRGVRDDPLTTTPPQGVPYLRNLGRERELPRPVGVANSDER